MTNDDPDVTSDQPNEPPAARRDREQVLSQIDQLLGRSPSNRRRGRPQNTTPSSAATSDAGDDEPAPDAGEPSLASIPMFANTASWTSPNADADDDLPTIDSADGPDRGWIAEDSQIDWQLVRKLKLASVDRLDEQIKQHRARHDGREPSVADRREMGKPIIARVVNEHAEANAGQGYLWTPALEDRYFKVVLDSQFGYGRLQPLFEIPTAENITIHGHKVVKVHYADGRTEIWPPVADSDEELLEQLRQMGSNATPARTIDGHQYEMTLMLDERFRLHAYSDEVSGQPRISIRQHRLTNITLGDLVDGGLMPEELARFLNAAVRANVSICVAGVQAVGKTTLLRALVDAIPMSEEFGTLETDLELFSHKLPGRESCAYLVARSGMGERGPDGKRIGEISVPSLVDMALRQNLQRLIVGEVRGAEASALFQAMTVGTGTMFTTHSPDPETVPLRLATAIAQGRVYTIDEAMRQIGLLLHLIVYVDVIDETANGGDRYRRITQVAFCSPGEDGRPAIEPIFTTDDLGNPLTFNPPPELVKKLRRHYRDSLPRRGKRAAVITLAALLGGMALAGAVVLMVTGLKKVPVEPRPTRRRRLSPGQAWARYTRRPAGKAGRQRDVRLVAGVAAGVAIFVFTGWLIAIPLVPVVMLLLPILFGRSPRSDIALLEALDRWVRTLATTLPGGRSVTQALRGSRSSAPPLLAEEIGELVDRLNWGWDPQEALQQFADRLDSPDADAVVASLKVAITHTEGITANLVSIADSLQERLRALRQIENERDRPRQTARIVTVISGLMIASTALFGRGYFTPYNTPVGQLIVAVLALAYVGSLILLYRMAMPRRRERILIRVDPMGATR